MKENTSKELKKELVSYISVYYDKKNLKEQNEIADEILKVFNKDKKFRNKVEKMAQKIKDDKQIKKGGRRKTRKKKKGGNGDWFNITNLGYFAAGMVICYGLYWFRRGVLAAEGMRNQWTVQNQLTSEEAEARAAAVRPRRVRELTPPSSPRRQVRSSNLRRRTNELTNSPIRTSGFQHFGPGIRIRAPQLTSSIGSGSSISSNNSFDTAPTFEGGIGSMMSEYPQEAQQLMRDQRQRAMSAPPYLYTDKGALSPRRTTIENRKKKKASPRNSQSSIESLREENDGIPTLPVGFPEVIRSRNDMEYGGDGGEVDLSLEDAFDDEGRPYSDSSSAEEDSSKDSSKDSDENKKKNQGGGRKRRKTRKKQKRRRK